MGKAHLVLEEKVTLRSGLIREAVIWKIPRTERYPQGIRYRLALVDPSEGKVLLLFDNHYPKGHHLHLSQGKETPYAFQSVELLVRDYLNAVKIEEGKYARKKN